MYELSYLCLFILNPRIRVNRVYK